jgi:hypothetical protein
MNRYAEELTIFSVSINADLLCCEVSTARDDPCHLPGNERLMTRDYESEDVVFEWKPRSMSSIWSLIVVVKAAFHFDHVDTERSKPISSNDDVRLPGFGCNCHPGTVWQGGEPLATTGAEVEHRVCAARKSIDEVCKVPRERFRLHASAEPREVPTTDGMRLSLFE